MSTGALGVVEEWLDAVERRDGDRLVQLSEPDVEVVGPAAACAAARCSPTGWRGPGPPPGRCAGPAARTASSWWWSRASQFLVRGAVVARYARHDALEAALGAAGLSTADEVAVRGPG